RDLTDTNPQKGHLARWKSEGATGFGMSHRHAQGYNSSPDCQLAALADISEENAKAFQDVNGGDNIYLDYRKMLEKETLDIVSISTWPHLHAEMVIACAEAGVKAVHCEKPMAVTFAESKKMVEVCQATNTQLTFNHQRRFGEPFRKAKAIIDEGAIGDLVRLEGTCGDLFDWGTHWFDMLNMYNNETPVEWVIGQIDMRDHKVVFGVTLEGQGLSQFRYQNGVMGLLSTGTGRQEGLINRIVGTAGTIEVGFSDDVPVRMWGKGQSDWTPVPVEEGLHGLDAVGTGVHDLVDALKTGRKPELSGDKALRATEMIYATYESSRRRARVDLPLDIDDSPLHAMLEAGDLTLK
ncbi:MAG: Gfo/Idh/MocA family oxidoreductase, partial [Chloroflexota bacterium]